MLIFSRVRGSLTSIYDPSYNVGILTSYILGNYFNLIDQIKIQLVVPVIFLLILWFIPESPEHHHKNNDHQVIVSFQRVWINVSTHPNFAPHFLGISMCNDNHSVHQDREVSSKGPCMYLSISICCPYTRHKKHHHPVSHSTTFVIFNRSFHFKILQMLIELCHVKLPINRSTTITACNVFIIFIVDVGYNIRCSSHEYLCDGDICSKRLNATGEKCFDNNFTDYDCREYAILKFSRSSES